MQRSKSVDDYLRQKERWRPELEELRRILRTTGLVETIKWGGPCYTYRDKNVVGISLGKQREYAQYVAEAKRDETRRRRIGKILPMILAGTGLNDRYR